MSYPGIGIDETYKEGVFVGYRWFDRQRLAPAFPFGFGLSYTRFAYSALRVRRTPAGVRVGFTVKNVGTTGGAAAPQLYVGLPSPPGVPEPPLQLQGFEKIALAPGRRARVRFLLAPRALSHWDVGSGSWRVASGCYRVRIGSSSRGTPLRGAFAIAATCGRGPRTR